MNAEALGYLGVMFEKREIYAVDYVEELLKQHLETLNLDTSRFVTGRVHRKTLHQRQYQEMEEYLERLKNYAGHIEICGE